MLGRLNSLALAFLGCLMLTALAQGQATLRPPQVGDAFQPDWRRQDLSRMSSYFGLDGDQQTVLELLLSDYEESFREEAAMARGRLQQVRPAQTITTDESRVLQEEIVEELQRIVQEMAEEPSPEEVARLRDRAQELREQLGQGRAARVDTAAMARALGEMRQRLDAWRSRKDALGAEFVSDVQATVLTDEQRERWPAFERERRRERTLGSGRLSGENVDLFKLVTELGLSGNPDVQETLGEYDAALDDALRRREEYAAASERELEAMIDVPDLKGAARIFQRRAELHAAVRDVNDRFALALASRLDDALAKRLTQEHLDRGYPRVYRATAAQRLFKAAVELPEVPPDTIAAIEELERSFLAELDLVNRQLVQTVRQYEPESFVQRELLREAQAREFETPAVVDPVQEAVDRRRELEDRYVTQLEALLNPEQRARLPRYSRVSRSGDDQPGLDDESEQAVLRRFDRNGDGRLDEQETLEMRQHLRNGG